MPCKALAKTLLFTLVTLGAAASAEAREETVRWTHAQGEQVAEFRIQVGTSPGAADLIDESIGLPQPDGAGIYSFTLDVDYQATLYVQMTAVDSGGLASDPSNTISRSLPLGMPGVPTVQP